MSKLKHPQPGSILGNISTDEMRIWKEGFQIGQNGASRDENPYQKNTREWELWDDGWYKGYA